MLAAEAVALLTFTFKSLEPCLVQLRHDETIPTYGPVVIHSMKELLKSQETSRKHINHSFQFRGMFLDSWGINKDTEKWQVLNPLLYKIKSEMTFHYSVAFVCAGLGGFLLRGIM